jgi:tetratricopeptide (TPR) repeat protein
VSRAKSAAHGAIDRGSQMSDKKQGLETLGAVVRGDGFPTFNPRAASPLVLQKLLDEGLAHHRADRKEEAERCYRQVLETAPNQPDALNLLGVLAAGAGLHDLAIDLMKRALTVRPKDPNILNNLGQALYESFRFEEARDPLERALALKPDFDEAKYNLARLLRQLGEADMALRLWREVWAADDRVFAALVGITGVLSDQGHFEDAERTAREVIARLPHRPAGYISLAHVHKFKTDDGTLAEVESQLASNDIPEPDKIALHYAAGKICDDLKMFERAFKHFDQANGKAHRAYDHQQTEKVRQQKKTVFSKKYYRERQGWGFASELPVFIIGMPRSGTSLTEQILAAHPDVFAAGEISAFEHLTRFSEEISPTRDEFPASALKLTNFGAELMGRRYISGLSRHPERPIKRVTNKMPHNFELLGMIALTLPGAKVIHCRRNPLDTCVSCWTKNFNDAHGYNRSLTDLGRYYRGYFDLMEHWRQVLPMPILDVDYENYTTDLEGTARRIVDFVGLDWDPQCLDFYKVERSVHTASNWQVRQPIYATSVGRWRNYMPHIQPLVDALGPLGAEASA